MQDKTAIGISDLLRQFIGALVEEVVLEGKPFDDQKKKYLQRYSQEEGLDYATLEKNLTEFFETVEELKSHESKAVERLAKMLAKDCYLKEDKVDDLLVAMNKAREKEAERIAAEKKAEEERLAALKKAEEERIAREKAERKAADEAKRKAKEEAERKKRKRIEAERKAKEETERRAREEAERKAKEEEEKKNETNLVFDAERGGFVCKAPSWEVKGELIIPASINGKVVSELGHHAFCYYSDIVSVVIPSTVKKIGFAAFESCYSLKIISIPNTVTEIGAQAFQNTSLKSVVIPNSVTHLGGCAFEGCKQLNSVVLSNSMSCIEWYTFHGCEKLSTLFIPDSITKIDKYAFEGCWNLERIQISRRTYERLKGQLLHDPYKNIYYFID